jgi:hypothetical protein
MNVPEFASSCGPVPTPTSTKFATILLWYTQSGVVSSARDRSTSVVPHEEHMPQVIESPPDSKVFTVQELYAKSSPLLVPSWQRDYSWQPDEHVQKLIDDLWEYNEGAEANPGRYYLLGQVILVPNSDKQNEIVDGQQRLTTVYLLLLCLLNTFKIDGRVALNVQKNAVIYSMLINSVVDIEDNIRLLLPSKEST